MKKILILCGVFLVLSGNAWALSSYTGMGSPIIGASVITTGGDVTATFVSGSGYYDNYLYLAIPANPYTNLSSPAIGSNWIFENHISTPGTTVDLGTFAPGTELIFNVLADTHYSDFSQNGLGTLNWYTGPASRNADGFAHAFVDSAYTGLYGGTLVGFEDLSNLGDAGYEDLRYSFTNVQSGTVPEPGTLLLLGSGLIGIVVFRKKLGAYFAH